METKILRRQIRASVLIVLAFMAGEGALFVLDLFIRERAEPMVEEAVGDNGLIQKPSLFTRAGVESELPSQQTRSVS